MSQLCRTPQCITMLRVNARAYYEMLPEKTRHCTEVVTRSILGHGKGYEVRRRWITATTKGRIFYTHFRFDAKQWSIWWFRQLMRPNWLPSLHAFVLWHRSIAKQWGIYFRTLATQLWQPKCADASNISIWLKFCQPELTQLEWMNHQISIANLPPVVRGWRPGAISLMTSGNVPRADRKTTNPEVRANKRPRSFTPF